MSEQPRKTPVCTTCNDTHAMTLGEREVMCTRCPRPCQRCRQGGNGPYCETTPCACACHQKSEPKTSEERLAFLKCALDGYSAKYLPGPARDDLTWLVAECERMRRALHRINGGRHGDLSTTEMALIAWGALRGEG